MFKINYTNEKFNFLIELVDIGTDTLNPSVMVDWTTLYLALLIYIETFLQI